METARSKRTRALCALVAVGLGALYTWAGRYAMNPDGITYLDLADAWLRGDWRAAFSSIWSPLYPWLLAIWMSLLKPSPAWEFQAVQLMNFMIYTGGLLAFDFLLGEVLQLRRQLARGTSLSERVPLPEWVIIIVGYAVFIRSSLSLIRVTLVTPHMSMVALMYLAAGICLRIQRRQPKGWLPFALLGVALGLAYLARWSMLALALVVLGLLAFRRPADVPRRAHLRRVFVAIAVFLAVGGAYVLPFVAIQGRLPFGDFPTYNYVTTVNRVPTHWQGGPPGSGTPRHPTRILVAKPAVYEFATPIGGTYPVGFDPYYWFEGVTQRFDLTAHARLLLRSLRVGPAAATRHWVPSIGLCALMAIFAWRRGWLLWGDIARYGSLLAIALAAFGLFIPLQVNINRYVGGFVPLVWLAVVSGIALPAGPRTRQAAIWLTVLIVAMHGLLFMPATVKRAYEVARDLRTGGGQASSDVQWQVAMGLQEMGLQPGGTVAVVTRGWTAYWARLARVRIIAEVPQAEEFWAADATDRQQILEKLRDIGVQILVAQPEVRPRSANSAHVPTDAGWMRIGRTSYYAYPLTR